ncbi:MAG: efflux RND transporter permease subunit [Bacteroidales bacterium]|nr:efflux RND transporter permease subunit [Bacteroidales bacterium]MDD4669462.1 efflux RND transporter permease subunit [Bacteroidales bacterium]
MDISKWALDNKKLVYFVIAALLIGGVYAFDNMSKLEDPEIRVKQAMVVTTYPGASPHQVELEISDVLEKNIRSMGRLDHVTSRSMNDVSIIEVGLSTLVPDSETEQMWDLLRRKVNDAQSSLPGGAGKSVVMDNFGDVYGMFYAVTNDGYTDKELNDYVEYIKREISTVDGVSDVIIYGERKDCINIDLSQERMANLGIHPLEILSTLNDQNKTAYSGYYNSGNQRIRVTVNDRYRSVGDIGDILLQGHEKDQLRLRDIATISIGHEEPLRNELLYDGHESLGLCISAQNGTDITKVGKKVDNKIEELKSNVIPVGIDFHKVFYQPERVNAALQSFLWNLLMSVVIVVLILMLTMGFRSGMIIGFNLVIIVLGSLLILNVFDGTLQRVSLGAFILAMGMLVDNAIVILDGILVDNKRGRPRKETLTAIGKKTAMPLLGATVIAILAFFPIFMSPDMAGTYVRDLFIVLAVSLLLSWILALIFVPIQADRMLDRMKKVKEEKDPFESNKFYIALRKVLSWTLCHKTVTIAGALVLVVSSIFCYRYLPQGFFPDMSYNQLYIEYNLPDGSNTEEVKHDLAQIEAYLHSREDVTHVTTSIGGTPARYNLVRSIATPSLSYGELIVDYTSQKTLVASIEEVQNYLNDNYPQAYARVKRYNLMYKKFPIEVQFTGPDPAVLKDLTAQAQQIMKESPKTRMECSDWEPQVPVMVVDYSQPIARELGMTRSDVATSLLSVTEGIPTSTFYDGNHRQTIYFRGVDDNGNSIEDLTNTSVFSMIPPVQNIGKNDLVGLVTGAVDKEDIIQDMLRTVPLSQATNGINIEWQDPVIIRTDGERAMKAQCEAAFSVGAEAARQSIAEQIESIPLPEGYQMSWEGEYKASSQSTKYLFKGFPLAIILMIMILLLLFKDYKKPAIIICCIPLLLVGVVFGVLASGKMFGFVAIVGVLGLIGMIIKNGVILMDEIKLQLDSGVEPMKALLDSSSVRFRPVMMASLTTILGMIPLLRDDLFGSLAVTIMGGLLVGTLITLIFIPVLYAVFFNIKTNKK